MKDTELITFAHQNIGEIRGLIKDGEPWFLAGQVCRCLGLENSSRVLAEIKEYHLRYQDKIEGVRISYLLLDTNGGKQKVAIVSESILYEMIFRSTKEKAFRFQQWVFGEVLPSLRKTGQYRMAGKMIRRDLTDEINVSGENERMHGHGYSTYTAIINKSLGLPRKNDRDTLSPETLEMIAQRENTVQALLREGKTYNEIKDFILSLSLVKIN